MTTFSIKEGSTYRRKKDDKVLKVVVNKGRIIAYEVEDEEDVCWVSENTFKAWIGLGRVKLINEQSETV